MENGFCTALVGAPVPAPPPSGKKEDVRYARKKNNEADKKRKGKLELALNPSNNVIKCDHIDYSNITSQKSPVFAAMFHYHSRVEAKTKAIIIEDVPFHTFQELIHYSYNGELSAKTHDVGEIQMIYVAASKYLMDDIKKYCLAYFEKNINNNNVIDLLAFLPSYQFPQFHRTPSIKIKTDPTNFLSTLEQMLHVHSAYQ